MIELVVASGAASAVAAGALYYAAGFGRGARYQHKALPPGTPVALPPIVGADRLKGVHPSLVGVVQRAAAMAPPAFHVIEGVRSRETAWANWGKGRTVAQLRAAGVPDRYARPGVAAVTWLRHPLASKHLVQPDGWGHAVDLFPEPYDWQALWAFDRLAKLMFAAAGELGIGLRWGADWNSNGRPRERGESDSPHFELML
ncbi:MAG: M15 family metallopeptidase [Sphingomonadaceae bacterium]|nr:M15 family metallopeptidase [Sphingomonadaceae bacterium]